MNKNKLAQTIVILLTVLAWCLISFTVGLGVTILMANDIATLLSGIFLGIATMLVLDWLFEEGEDE